MFNNTLNKNLGPTRKFRPESYKANDQKAKDIIIPYLESNGHTIIDSKEDFGVDIKSERSEERRVGKECRYRWWPYH